MDHFPALPVPVARWDSRRAMTLDSRSYRRSEEARRPTARLPEEQLPDHLGHVLALQRSAGNAAVANVLQRKVKIGKGWIQHKSKTPAVPAGIPTQFPAFTAEQLKAEADKWVGDAIKDGREFNDDTAFYTAVARSLVPAAAQVQTDDRGRWGILEEAVKTQGNVTAVPWTTFNAKEAPLLEDELLACTVQLSGNDKTSACHGNTHGKLPTRVVVPGGKALDQIPKSQQPNHTPYIEFLVRGQKTKSGIERGILDRNSGKVYLTAHYTKGSFVELVEVPGSVVADWQLKANQYVATL